MQFVFFIYLSSIVIIFKFNIWVIIICTLYWLLWNTWALYFYFIYREPSVWTTHMRDLIRESKYFCEYLHLYKRYIALPYFIRKTERYKKLRIRYLESSFYKGWLLFLSYIKLPSFITQSWLYSKLPAWSTEKKWKPTVWEMDMYEIYFNDPCGYCLVYWLDEFLELARKNNGLPPTIPEGGLWAKKLWWW